MSSGVKRRVWSTSATESFPDAIAKSTSSTIINPRTALRDQKCRIRDRGGAIRRIVSLADDRGSVAGKLSERSDIPDGQRTGHLRRMLREGFID